MKKSKDKKNSGQKFKGVGGTYVYDKELGKVVKISDEIPKVASKSAGGKTPSGNFSCGGPGCANGTCPMMGE